MGGDLPEYLASLTRTFFIVWSWPPERVGGSHKAICFLGKLFCLVSRLRTFECGPRRSTYRNQFLRALGAVGAALDLVLELRGPRGHNFLSLVKRCSRLVCGNSLEGSNQFNPAILGVGLPDGLAECPTDSTDQNGPFRHPSEDSNLRT